MTRTSRSRARARAAHALRKYRGTLRCEWCGRRTEVGPGFRWGTVPLRDWKRFVDDNPVFYCARARCVHARAGLVTETEVHADALDPDDGSRGRDRSVPDSTARTRATGQARPAGARRVREDRAA